MPLSRRHLIAAGAATTLAPSTARAAGIIRFGLSAYPPNLQPWVSTGQSAATVKLLLFRGLLSFGPDGEMCGEFAQSWSRDGDTGWIFHLRDAVFQSGARVTAADVAWSIDQVRDPRSTAYLRGQMQGVKSIETPDPRTVRIVMQKPTVTVPLWMANAQMPIIERRSMENGGPPIGAGSYTMAAQERGVAVELAAFPKFYKRGLPKTPRIRMTVYADENLRADALLAGDVDIIEYVPWPSMQAIEADPKLRLDGSVGPFMFLMFNGRTGPFKDPRVRLAAAYAIRREEIVQTAFFGRGAPLGGLPIPPGTEYCDAALADVWHYDPDRARSLLAEAGFPNGFPCTLLATAQYGMHKITAEVVQQHLAAIGIQAKLDLPEWGQRVTLGSRGQYEIAVHGTATDYNDPDRLASVMDGELPSSYGRSFSLPTPRLHELFEAGRREFDPIKRHAIYTELQQVALQQAPMVSLAWRLQAFGMSRKLQGFTSLPGTLSGVSGITLETTVMT